MVLARGLWRPPRFHLSKGYSMGDLLIVIVGAFVVAIIICVIVAKRELNNTKAESAKKQLEVSKKLEQEALDDALSYYEQDEDEE